MVTSRLGRPWLAKTGIFMLVLLIFGGWGLVDALFLYPRRGMADASYKFKNYLAAARDASKLSPAGVKVEDPKAALADLRSKFKDGQSIPDTPAARLDVAKLRWLEALSVVWKLKPEPILVGEGTGVTGSASTGAAATTPDAANPAARPADSKPTSRRLYFDMVQGTAYAEEGPAHTRVDVSLGGLLDELDKKWSRSDQTQPLAGYDLPVQWLFAIIGFGGGAYLALMILKAAGTKFRWDPGAMRLTLPGGRAIVPADLKDIDKRRWHKFYVTLLLNDGSSHTLDLYRFEPLESWVLEMERAAFPDRAAAPAPSSVAGPVGDGGTGEPAP